MERLLNILTKLDKRHVWILNRKYCPLKAMADGKAEVLYSYEPVAQETPFSLDAIMNIETTTTRLSFRHIRPSVRKYWMMMSRT